MLEKQELLQEQLNNQPPVRADRETSRSPTPREKGMIESEKKTLEELQNSRAQGLNGLRDLRRQIPSLAQDFNQQVELLSGNIDILIENNSELQGEIICLMEEKKAQKIIAKIEDEKTSRLEFELGLLK
jgi:hypothetical protein